MSKLNEAINEELDRLMCAHRVMLHHGPTAICGRDPTAIASAVPEVCIDAGHDRFKNRRRKIRLKRGAAHLTLLARHRPIPEELDQRGLLVQWSANGDERGIPLSCVTASADSMPSPMHNFGAVFANRTAPPAISPSIIFGFVTPALPLPSARR